MKYGRMAQSNLWSNTKCGVTDWLLLDYNRIDIIIIIIFHLIWRFLVRRQTAALRFRVVWNMSIRIDNIYIESNYWKRPSRIVNVPMKSNWKSRVVFHIEQKWTESKSISKPITSRRHVFCRATFTITNMRFEQSWPVYPGLHSQGHDRKITTWFIVVNTT